MLLVVRSGHIACLRCGLVQEERVINNEAEYHIFEGDDDAEKKVRVSGNFNIKSNYEFVGTNQRQYGGRDEHEFLKDGLHDIENGMRRVLRTGRNARCEARAKEIFRRAYDWMFLQKQGINKIYRSVPGDDVPAAPGAEDVKQEPADAQPQTPRGRKTARSGGGGGGAEQSPSKVQMRKKRLNFARRKAFVVGALLIALREFDIPQTVAELDHYVDGASVNDLIVYQALRDIGMVSTPSRPTLAPAPSMVTKA